MSQKEIDWYSLHKVTKVLNDSLNDFNFHYCNYMEPKYLQEYITKYPGFFVANLDILISHLNRLKRIYTQDE